MNVTRPALSLTRVSLKTSCFASALSNADRALVIDRIGRSLPELVERRSARVLGRIEPLADRVPGRAGPGLVDRIIPSVPVRQWVLSLPFDVRARAAFDARFLTEVIRALASALRDRHRKWAGSIALDDAEFAAITFVQRFGSSLNLNVHLHVVVADGVFSRDRGGLAFTAASAPTRAEMLAIVRKVRRRVEKLAADKAADVQLPLGACARVALSRGDVRAVSVDLQDDGAEPPEPPAHDGAAVDEDGYNLEATARSGRRRLRP